MKRRWWHLGAVGAMVVIVLAGCGGGSTSDPTATVVATATTVASVDNVEPTGEPAGTVAMVTHPPEPPVPTSTLYALNEPTPTALADAECTYGSETVLKFDTFEQYRAELHACNEVFTWPAGYEIDPEKIAFQPGADMVAGGESGLGRSVISLNNACAWMTYWSDATKAGDQEAADEALQYMLTIYPTWGNTDETVDSFRNILEKAALGDSRPLMQELGGLTCGLYEPARVSP